MSETLTDTHTPAMRGAMAPAAPETAGAAPAATAATPGTVKAAPPAPRKGGPGWPGGEAEGVSTAPATETLAPGHLATPPAAQTFMDRAMGWLLMGLAGLLMPVVGVIGFASSYKALEKFATEQGFGSLAWTFPIGIDGAILAFLAWDLILVRRGTPWPPLRFAAHFMTVVTIVFNAAHGIGAKPGTNLLDALWADPMGAWSHGLMPFLFVLGVEGVRHLLVHMWRLEEGTAGDRVPLHRWILSPIRTARLYRRMRLAAVRSYTDMVEREQALEGYRVWLKNELGGDLSKASDEQLLPMTMAPRGYTVEEALALPAKWKAQADERKAEEEDRKAEAEVAEAERNANLKIKELEADNRIKAAESRIKAATRTAAARSESEAVQAESQAETDRVLAESATDAARLKAQHLRRAAEQEAAVLAQAQESAELAEARARKAEAERIEAQEAAATQEARQRTERAAAETERIEAQRQREAADRARDARRTAEDLAQAELIEADTARQRAARAMAEAAAEAAEDYARLSSRQRNARRVARMLIHSQPGTPADLITHDAVSLREVQERLGVSQTIAGELRHEAIDLLAAGYADQAATDAAFEPNGQTQG
ncbi:DUF2637 domain-containing protein [Streptomyces zaomyceticus]|uniref:DUF2637 domain-containing protein n=1 Tax=Streptomyces zaomyceticus TaxID=68286 RepID=UPI00324CA6BC